MIDRIVQEQYLCRLNKDRNQRKQAMANQDIDTSCQNSQDTTHHRTNNRIPQDCQQHSDDTCRKVVDQHFKSGRHMTIHQLIKFFNTKTCQRSHNHCSHKHCDRSITHNGTNNCDRTYYTTSVAAHHFSTCGCDQNRNQISQHR